MQTTKSWVTYAIRSLPKRSRLLVLGISLLSLTSLLCAYWATPTRSTTPTTQPLAYTALQANEAVYPPQTYAAHIPTSTLAITWGNILHDEIYIMAHASWPYTTDSSSYVQLYSRCETAVRPPAELAYSMAVALQTSLLDNDPSLKSEITSKTLLLIKSLAYRHISNNPDPNDRGRWGYDLAADDSRCLNSVDAPQGGKANMQSAWWAEMIGFAAWLNWSNPGTLAPQDKTNISNMVQYEANRYIQSFMRVGSYDPAARSWSNIWSPNILYLRDAKNNLPSYNSTFAEEDAWNIRILDLATSMMPNHNNWEIWNAKATELSLAALSRPADISDATYIAGRPLSAWLNGSNIEDDGTLYDHDIIYPNYMGAIIHSMHSPLIAAFAAMPSSLARLHNVDLVYNALVNKTFSSPPYNPPGGTIYRPTTFITSTISTTSPTSITPPAQPSSGIYYPQDLPHGESLIYKHDLFAQIDTEVAALGLDTYNNHNNYAPYWASLHIEGVYRPSATDQVGASLRGSVLGDFDLPKAADAYLTLWLRSQTTDPSASPPLSDLPLPWRDADLLPGTSEPPSPTGHALYSHDEFSLTAGKNPSIPHIVYRSWSGDADFIAHISGTSTSATSGIFIRESLNANEPYLQLSIDTTAGNSILAYQTSPTSLITQQADTKDSWLKLSRRGNVFTAYTAPDSGTLNWQSVGSLSLPMASRVYMGMFVTGTNARSTFDSLSINRSYSELTPALIIVGNPGSLGPQPDTSLWQAQGDGTRLDAPWLEYDLGSIHLISSIGITWADNATKSYTFEVLASTDEPESGRRWDRLYAGTGTSGISTEEMFHFMPVAARYIRILGRGNSVDDWNRIQTLKIYGSSLQQLLPASNTSDNVLSSSLDNDLSTKWSSVISSSSPAQLQIDFGSSHKLNTIAIAWANGNHAKYSFRLEQSADNKTWSTLYESASSGTTQLPELYSFSQSTARWVRLTCTNSTEHNTCAVTELGAFSVP